MTDSTTKEQQPVETHDGEDEELLAEEPRSILLGIIAQLRKGMDLHRVALPTFVLEPRSMCERISDFLSHQDIIIKTGNKDDPVERFLDVVKYFLSGWHIRPKGVKKPFNPVLGEFFRCRWKFPDGTESFYICEQVSHHPPMSAYFYASPENGIQISGNLCPKARFLGNSAATLMKGTTSITFDKHPGEVYEVYNPNVYARGILFGRMCMEIGDMATIRCAKSDLVCSIEFKTKGIFHGESNVIVGKIKRESTGEILHKLSGTWTDTIYLHNLIVGADGKEEKSVFFKVYDPTIPKDVVSADEQEEFESRRLWCGVADALRKRNIDLADDEKKRIEDNQRDIVKIREESGVVWRPRFFKQKASEEFVIDTILPKDMDRLLVKKALVDYIFAKPSDPLYQSFWTKPITE